MIKRKNSLKIRKRRPKLQSQFSFDRKQAIRLFKTEYYRAQAHNIQSYEFLEKEKLRLSTPRSEEVTQIIDSYKSKGLVEEWKSSAAKILMGIYNKNKDAALSGRTATNERLLELLAKPELLLLAYKAIRGNKGALTKGAEFEPERYRSLDPEQQRVVLESIEFPDGFNMSTIFRISRLIKKRLYPWGSSNRVYVPKPGVKDKMRPITIPPFMDRVVQKAISIILEAIYEPEFEILNRSFGFRPNKGVHDAIAAISSNYSAGKTTAIEGDIEAAYDTVDKQRLLQILSTKINDRGFLETIKQRLDYDFVQIGQYGEERIRPPQGIPQGGIDSPYLFNIYLHELDKFVHTDLNKFVTDKNQKLTAKRSDTKLHNRIKADREKAIRHQRKIKEKLRIATNEATILELRKELFAKIKELRKLATRSIRVKAHHPHKKNLSILYVRYADDWILVTNANTQIAKQIKDRIAKFLETELKLKLSEKKTIITDLTKDKAHFLGYELKHNKFSPIIREPITKENSRKKSYLNRMRGGAIIWTSPDRQRLISRLHMKGFCDKNGFPRELPWLSTIEPHVIIERYNASITGLCNYYFGSIRNSPLLQRWIYILRFSCLKTFAQKYRMSTKQIMKRFGIKIQNKSQCTIEVKVLLKVGDKTMEKTWTLLTYKELKERLLPRGKSHFRDRVNKFWGIEHYKHLGEYPLKSGRIPSITDENYLDAISWVSLRTQASFDLPCAKCGSLKEVHQHHVRHVRKNA